MGDVHLRNVSAYGRCPLLWEVSASRGSTVTDLYILQFVRLQGLFASVLTEPPPLATNILEFNFGESAGLERTRMWRTILMANQIIALAGILSRVLMLHPSVQEERASIMFMESHWGSPLLVRNCSYSFFVTCTAACPLLIPRLLPDIDLFK